MIHEFKKIIENSVEAHKMGLKTVLASVVALSGSSYRKPGVRMLIREDDQMTGAVSGGCVEKEVLRQAQEVLETGSAKLICYDGRYRLGCEGTLFILLEPFNPSEELVNAFNRSVKERTSFSIASYFLREEGLLKQGGSIITFNDQCSINFSESYIDTNGLECFIEVLEPCFKLVIVGAEHDAVQLCAYAAFTGWEVTVIASMNDPKNITHFPGALELLHLSPEEISTVDIDEQTAVILMSHNYATDLQYLLRLKNTSTCYIGILGPTKRRNSLLDELINCHPDIDHHWFDRVHGPAGLSIGSVTPQEIAISIISEILTVIRKEEPMSLKDKKGRIHRETIN
jgi:xanthine dehydrogenase accessory factor